MRAVLLRGARHETHVRHGAHRARVERAVLAAVVDDRLVHARVAAVGNHGECVAELAARVVHLAAGADERRHRRVDDDVARDVQVRDALVGVDVGESGAGGVGGLNVGFDRRALIGGQRLDLLRQVTETVVQVHAELRERSGVLFEQIFEEHAHRVAEDDGVGDLHHRRLEVQGEKDPLALRARDLLFVERDERALSEHGAVEHLSRLRAGASL